MLRAPLPLSMGIVGETLSVHHSDPVIKRRRCRPRAVSVSNDAALPSCSPQHKKLAPKSQFNHESGKERQR